MFLKREKHTKHPGRGSKFLSRHVNVDVDFQGDSYKRQESIVKQASDINDKFSKRQISFSDWVGWVLHTKYLKTSSVVV